MPVVPSTGLAEKTYSSPAVNPLTAISTKEPSFKLGDMESTPSDMHLA